MLVCVSAVTEVALQRAHKEDWHFVTNKTGRISFPAPFNVDNYQAGEKRS
jgi:hypothetical protein